MTTYKYRLTIVFSSTLQWKIGVETSSVGETIAREITRDSGDVQTVCLSHEKTGKVIWLRRGAQYQT